MVELFLVVLSILIAIGVVALLYYLTIWALRNFGVPIPTTALRIGFVVLVLVIIYFIIAGGFPNITATYRR